MKYAVRYHLIYPLDKKKKDRTIYHQSYLQREKKRFVAEVISFFYSTKAQFVLQFNQNDT